MLLLLMPAFIFLEVWECFVKKRLCNCVLGEIFCLFVCLLACLFVSYFVMYMLIFFLYNSISDHPCSDPREGTDPGGRLALCSTGSCSLGRGVISRVRPRWWRQSLLEADILIFFLPDQHYISSWAELPNMGHPSSTKFEQNCEQPLCRTNDL